MNRGGVWSSAWSPSLCVSCQKAGRTGARMEYYVSHDPSLTALQLRCPSCRHVETLLSSLGARVSRSARVYAAVAIGEAIAIGAIILAASAIAALK